MKRQCPQAPNCVNFIYSKHILKTISFRIVLSILVIINKIQFCHENFRTKMSPTFSFKIPEISRILRVIPQNPILSWVFLDQNLTKITKFKLQNSRNPQNPQNNSKPFSLTLVTIWQLCPHMLYTSIRKSSNSLGDNFSELDKII